MHEPALHAEARAPQQPRSNGHSAASRAPGPPVDRAAARARWRARASRALALALLVAVGGLIIGRARSVDWPAVGQALAAKPPVVLLFALACATAAHAVYASYDLIARRYLQHAVPRRQVMVVGLVSYAFNLNFGSLVGGIGLRWRLYSRLGLGADRIGRIFALSLVTNWSGYLLLAGLLMATRSFELPPMVAPAEELQQVLGLALLAVPLGYLVWCATATRRELLLRGHRLVLPPLPVAVRQVATSALHWALAGAVVWALMPQGLEYLTVLGTLLAAAIVGAAVHVPGGLGVIEAVFVAALADRAPEAQLIAAVLAYRACFYLLPLAGAVALYFGLEAHMHRAVRPPQ